MAKQHQTDQAADDKKAKSAAAAAVKATAKKPLAVQAIKTHLVSALCKQHGLKRNEAWSEIESLEDATVQEAVDGAIEEHPDQVEAAAGQPAGGGDGAPAKRGAGPAGPVKGRVIDSVLAFVTSPIGQAVIDKLMQLLGFGATPKVGKDKIGSEHGGTAPHGQTAVNPDGSPVQEGQPVPEGQMPVTPVPDATPRE